MFDAESVKAFLNLCQHKFINVNIIIQQMTLPALIKACGGLKVKTHLYIAKCSKCIINKDEKFQQKQPYLINFNSIKVIGTFTLIMLTNYYLLLKSIKEAIFILDKDGNIKYATPETSVITGFSTNEILNKPISILYNNEDALKTGYELEQSIKEKKFISEGWKLKKDKSRFWGEMILSPVYDDDQIFSGYSCILRDISEKKKEEIDLKISEERYRLLVEGVTDYSIFMLDPLGNIMTWNEGAHKMKGYSVEEIIGKHFSIFYTSEDLKTKKPERELKIAVETGKYEEEGWRVKKNGSVFWANVVITPLFNERNKHIGFSKVTRDLTERRAAEESLRQSEERFRSLVEQVIDYAIFMLDEKGRIISWNEGARRIKGYNANEIIGKYFSIFYPEEDLLNGKPAHELKVARKTGKYEEEGWRVRKDGTQFWANVLITAIYNTKGMLIGFSKVTRDLTERKASEKALRDSYDQLSQLANELKETNQKLTYANQELEQFTSIVSHDLQEPVRSIKSFLQLIDIKLNERENTELNTYISKSINAANRMKELIQNLLQYSQLSRGESIRGKVIVNDLFNEALQNLKTSIEKTEAKITIKNKVTEVYGDRVQLVQLIQNLLSNALKFTESGHPEIKISTSIEKGYVKFAISDNGIGIARTDLNKMFEIFRRLNTKKEYPGTGIGLAICKKIVERHRGRIWPESEPGKGTTFYFTLSEEPKEIAV
jgi:PAS domain S-box-containing protein